MQPSAAIGTRIIGPFASLSSSTGDGLSNLIPGQLPTGSIAWVVDQAMFYWLDRSATTAVSSPNVVATGFGASRPGRWFRLETGGGDTPLSNVFWVDKGAAPGGNGSQARPFNTVTAGVAACPTGGTLLICPANYSAEGVVAIGNKSMTFIGEAGQRTATLVIMPTMTYDSAVTQSLCFRNIGVVTIDAIGTSVNTNIVLDRCADVTLAGVGGDAFVRAGGDPSCLIRGESGILLAGQLVIEGFTANSVFGLNNCEIRGPLVAGIEAAIYASLWSAVTTVTAPTLTVDSITLNGALSVATTFSVTPRVRASFLGNTPGYKLTCQPDGYTWQGEPTTTFLTGTATLTAQTIGSDSGATVTGAVTGAVVGDFVIVKCQSQVDLADLTLLPGIVTAPDVVQFVVQNRTAGDIDAPELTFELLVIQLPPP